MFGKIKIDTDSAKIDQLLDRGVGEVIDREHLKAALLSGKQLRVKLGIDPTAPDLHIGHAVVLRKLKEFQDLGHQAVLIIGSFTAQIGDPTGRSVERKVLTAEQVKKNLKSFLSQAAKVINVKKLETHYNADWFKSDAVMKVVELARAGSIQQMLHRADFKKRIAEGNDITILEMMYPLYQGYDSVMVKADVEIGGTDQTFNLLVGRRVQRHFKMAEQDILTVPLLEGLDGVEKMSKSKGNYIGLTDTPSDMFGKVMSVKDELIEKYFKLCTNLTDEEIAAVAGNPKDRKIRLAHEIVKMYHGSASSPRAGEKAAHAAQAEFERVFSKGSMPTEIPELTVEAHAVNIVELIVLAQMATSKSEARRLIEQGGVRINEVKKTDPTETIPVDTGMVLQVGPRKFVKIKRK
jgi:tyrosyl-tRNA synthetase